MSILENSKRSRYQFEDSEVAPGRGKMHVIDRTGDTEIGWDSTKENEVKIAEGHFEALKKQGYMATRIYKDGKPGDTMTKFDARAEKIIMHPPMVGG